jgi:hypothetical protein
METTKEMCLKKKEEGRERSKQLSIDEKIKRVEALRRRVQTIRNLRMGKRGQVNADVQNGQSV